MTDATTKIRWVVEWVKSCPVDEDGTCSIDEAEEVREVFKDRDAAIARLKEIEAKKLDFFGQPCMEERVWQFDFHDEDIGRDIYSWETDKVWYIEDGELYE